MKKKIGRQPFIDGRECLKLWAEKGSVPKMRDAYNEKYGPSPLSKKPFHAWPLWFAARKYMIEYPKDAKPIVDYSRRINGQETLEQEQWEKELVRSASFVFAQAPWKWVKWMDENGYERYLDDFSEFVRRTSQRNSRFKRLYEKTFSEALR